MRSAGEKWLTVLPSDVASRTFSGTPLGEGVRPGRPGSPSNTPGDLMPEPTNNESAGVCRTFAILFTPFVRARYAPAPHAMGTHARWHEVGSPASIARHAKRPCPSVRVHDHGTHALSQAAPHPAMEM